MIKRVNERPLSVDERKSILMRAVNAAPFFNDIEIDVLSVFDAGHRRAFKNKSLIYLDFFITEVRANYEQVDDLVSSDFETSIYLANSGIPIYGYNKSQLLPTSFVATDFKRTATPSRFDDRQRESIPFKVAAGDEVITQIMAVSPFNDPATLHSVLCGFNIVSGNTYLNDTETKLINKSLDDETVFQMFQLEIDHVGQKIYNFFNDSVPRLILGFGIVNKNTNEPSTVDIFDTIRNIKITNQPMPIEAIAPRVPDTVQTHMYYLPIEHYFCPFGDIRLTIDNAISPLPVDNDEIWRLVMLTRTV